MMNNLLDMAHLKESLMVYVSRPWGLVPLGRELPLRSDDAGEQESMLCRVYSQKPGAVATRKEKKNRYCYRRG